MSWNSAWWTSEMAPGLVPAFRRTSARIRASSRPGSVGRLARNRYVGVSKLGTAGGVPPGPSGSAWTASTRMLYGRPALSTLTIHPGRVPSTETQDWPRTGRSGKPG